MPALSASMGAIFTIAGDIKNGAKFLLQQIRPYALVFLSQRNGRQQAELGKVFTGKIKRR